MKAIILAGGLGTRLAEKTTIEPKPMVKIGGYPILWHIMKIYHSYGINEFIPALGYKGDVIKNYFLNYKQLTGSFSIDLASGKIDLFENNTEEWKVHLLETGRNTQTGGRIKKAMEFA